MADVEKIRELFLRPQLVYTIAEAAALLGTGDGDLRAWVATGELEPLADDPERVPWAELVSFAMDFWSQEVVEDALGADAAEVIPELVRLTELAVRIPRLEVVALERVAARERRSVDSVLARELLDFASANALWLDAEVPGVLAALAWPEVSELTGGAAIGTQPARG